MRNGTDTKELRKFGLLVGGVFAGFIGLLLPWFFNKSIPTWPFVVAIPFITLALALPKGLKPVFLSWMFLGDFLGWINTRIILIIIFVFILTPLALLKKVFSSDSLHRKFNKTQLTYRKVASENKKPSLERTY